MSAPNAEAVRHRFTVLPYGGTPNILVVVCDCGWVDMTDCTELGLGWDAACLYAVHMGNPDPRDIAAQKIAARTAHIDGSGVTE